MDQSKKVSKRRVPEKEIVTLAAQRLFKSPDGVVVLKKLSKMCNENEPTFVDQNPTGSAYREGQRSIILGIRKLLGKTFDKPVQEKATI